MKYFAYRHIGGSIKVKRYSDEFGKGLLVGTPRRIGQLCGETQGAYRYYDTEGKRQSAKKLSWVSSQFKTKEKGNSAAA